MGIPPEHHQDARHPGHDRGHREHRFRAEIGEDRDGKAHDLPSLERSETPGILARNPCMIPTAGRRSASMPFASADEYSTPSGSLTKKSLVGRAPLAKADGTA